MTYGLKLNYVSSFVNVKDRELVLQTSRKHDRKSLRILRKSVTHGAARESTTEEGPIRMQQVSLGVAQNNLGSFTTYYEVSEYQLGGDIPYYLQNHMILIS